MATLAELEALWIRDGLHELRMRVMAATNERDRAQSAAWRALVERSAARWTAAMEAFGREAAQQSSGEHAAPGRKETR